MWNKCWGLDLQHFECIPKLQFFPFFIEGHSLANTSLVAENVKKWCNRWFKRQLAKWTVADLSNSMVTCSKDGHQLILPNYSDMPHGPEGSVYRVDSAASACIHGHKHLRSTYPCLKQQSMQKWGAKSRAEQGDWRGRGPHRHLCPIPRGVMQCWPCSNAEAICGFSQQRPRKTRRVLWFDLSWS